MIGQLLQLAQLALGVACFGAIVFAVARSALAAVVIVLATFVVFDATAPPLFDIVVQFGSTSIYPRDVVAFALLTVGSWRLFTSGVDGPAKIPLAALVVLLAMSLLWGFAEFGVEHATNHARFWLAILSGLVFGATVKSWDRRVVTAFIAAGAFLAALSVIRVFQHGLYSATTFIDVGGQSVDSRPVLALGVLVMLNALVMLFGRGGLTLATTSLAALLAIGIVLLQHRTLWVAAIICGTLGVFHLASRYRASYERIVYLATGLMLLAVPALLLVVSRVGAYQESVESATGSSSTLTWRLGAWRELLEKQSSAFDLALGTPSGSDRTIVVDGWVTNLSAHNLYVETILQFGLIGLFALCAVVVLAFRFRRETARRLELAVPAVVILLVSVLLVAVTHSPGQVHGLLLGVLVAAACYQTQPGLTRKRIALTGRELAPTR